MPSQWKQQCISMRDSQFLLWIYERLIYVYKESENTDYIYRLKQIQQEVERLENA